MHQYAFPYKQEVKSLVWYSPDNFAEKGYDGPRDLGRPDGPPGQDRCRRRHAVVHRCRVRAAPPAGRRPTGSRTSCCARSRPRSMTAGSSNEIKFNDPKDRRRDRRCSAPSPSTTSMSPAASRPSRTTAFGDSPKGLFTVPPQCYMHHQASFIPSFFPEGTVAGEDYNFFYLPASTCGRSRQAGARFGQPRDHHQGLAGRSRLHRLPEDADRPRDLDGPAGRLVPFGAQGRQHRSLQQPGQQGPRPDPAQRHDVPLRRFGPDARPDRRRRVLDRHGRLRERQVGAGSGRRIQAAWDKL